MAETSGVPQYHKTCCRYVIYDGESWTINKPMSLHVMHLYFARSRQSKNKQTKKQR